jgi:hypothetical protein
MKRISVRRPTLVLAGLAAFLVAFRLSLPPLVKWYVNRTLDRVPGYGGKIGDVDIRLWRGAYRIEGLDIVKESGRVPVPFISADTVDFSVEWKQVLNGSLVGEVQAQGLDLNFVQGRSREDSQLGVEEAAAQEQGPSGQKHVKAAKGWQETVTRLFPLRINRFEIRDGTLHFRNFQSRPPVDVYLDRVNAVATNLTNSEKVSESLAATLELEARPMGHGTFQIGLQMNPYAQDPAFDLDTRLRDLDLAALNGFFRHYAKIDVQGGRLEAYAEMAASEGKFEGYLTPMVQNLNVMNTRKENLTFLAMAREGAAEFLGQVLENRSKDQLATKLVFSGRFDQPEIKTLAAVGYALRHAFIKPLPARIEGSVGRRATP